MARKPRAKAESGIYHVILRGINKQDVFLEEYDFKTMIRSLLEAQIERSPTGEVLHNRNCTYYAYCILHNHMHLLIREGEMTVSEVMKRVENRFVRLYNDHYERLGHLFQDRFVSEPVDDVGYFYQLIRYIHRNPVKAMEATVPEGYEYSSWREYLLANERFFAERRFAAPSIMLCDTRNVIKRFGDKNIEEWVNMDIDDKCMDMDTIAWKVSDATAWEILKEISDTYSVEEFKQLSKEWQLKYIQQLLEHGVSLNQASRLSSLTYASLWRHFKKDESE